MDTAAISLNRAYGLARTAVPLCLCAFLGACWTQHVSWLEGETPVSKNLVRTEYSRSCLLEIRSDGPDSRTIALRVQPMKREVRTFENVYARAEVRRSYSPLLELIEIPLALVGGALSSVSTVLVWIVATPFYHWFYLAPCMVSTGLPRGEFSFEKCFQRDWPKEQPDPAAYLTLFLPGIAVGLIMAANESEDVNAGAALGLFGIIAGMLSFNLHLTALPVAYYKTALFLLRPAWLFALPALLGDPERLIDPTRNAFAWEFVRPAGEVRRVQAREEGPLVPDSEARISKVHLEFRSTDGRPLYRDELDANMNGDLTLDLGRFESLSATSSGLIVEATVLEGEYQAEARMEIDSASLKRMFSK